MKKIILVMMALLTMTTAMAQPSDRKAPKKMTHQEMTTQMTSKLKLNDAQKAKVAALRMPMAADLNHQRMATRLCQRNPTASTRLSDRSTRRS